MKNIEVVHCKFGKIASFVKFDQVYVLKVI